MSWQNNCDMGSDKRWLALARAGGCPRAGHTQKIGRACWHKNENPTAQCGEKVFVHFHFSVFLLWLLNTSQHARRADRTRDGGGPPTAEDVRG
jgi:hypothetical protein